MLFLLLGTGMTNFAQNLFEKSTDHTVTLEELELADGQILQVDSDIYSAFLEDRANSISINLPLGNKENVELEIHQVNIFAGETNVTSMNNGLVSKEDYQAGLFYRGKVKGQETSLVALSFFEDEVMGVISFGGHNYNLEKLNNHGTETYVIYHDQSLGELPSFICHTKDDVVDQLDDYIEGHGAPSKSIVAVTVYLECDYVMYQDFSSNVTTTTNYATGLFNVVAGIYNLSSVTISISQVMVHTTQDPYHAGTESSSGPVLDAFECALDTYNGRVAHLLSTSDQNLGGLANRPYHESTSCSTGGYSGFIYGFSNIDDTYNSNLSVYSWSVEVLAHELGHNLSLPHTHACSWNPWNGGSDQIDDCGSVAGYGSPSCYNSGSPILPGPNNGTIMSYCHLVSGQGIDLSQGFHSDVEPNLQDFVDDCISLNSPNPTCAVPTSADYSITGTTANSVTITNAPGSGATKFRYGRREVGSNGYTYWETSLTTFTISGLTTGVTYEFFVARRCGDWTKFSFCDVLTATPSSCAGTLQVTPSSTPPFVSGSSLYTTGTVTISNGEDVVYSSPNIDLNAHFEVEAGAIFETSSAGCN